MSRKRLRPDGVGFEDTSLKASEMSYISSTPSAESASDAFLDLQRTQQTMLFDIRNQFLEEERKRYYKSWDSAKKEEYRRDARLDMQEQNRREKADMEMRLRSEIMGSFEEELGRVNGLLEERESELARERLKVRALEAELRELREGRGEEDGGEMEVDEEEEEVRVSIGRDVEENGGESEPSESESEPGDIEPEDIEDLEEDNAHENKLSGSHSTTHHDDEASEDDDTESDIQDQDSEMEVDKKGFGERATVEEVIGKKNVDMRGAGDVDEKKEEALRKKELKIAAAIQRQQARMRAARGDV